MDEKKTVELGDEALDDVAGGRDGWVAGELHCIRNKDYACSNCGGHEFAIVDTDGYYYNGNCLNCGTHNLRAGILGIAEIFTI